MLLPLDLDSSIRLPSRLRPSQSTKLITAYHESAFSIVLLTPPPNREIQRGPEVHIMLTIHEAWETFILQQYVAGHKPLILPKLRLCGEMSIINNLPHMDGVQTERERERLQVRGKRKCRDPTLAPPHTSLLHLIESKCVTTDGADVTPSQLLHLS